MPDETQVFQRVSDVAAKVREAKTMPDEDLFTVNINKTGLVQKRQKLAADRFEVKNANGHLKSLTEQTILKKLRQKQAPQKKAEQNEFVDLWATPVEEKSKKAKEYEKFAAN